MNKNITIAALIGGLVVAAGFWISKPDVKVIEPAVRPNPSVGAITGPSVPSDYFCIGGVCEYYRYESKRLSGTTNTSNYVACALQAPPATSTLVRATVEFSDATTTARKITFGKGIYAGTSTEAVATGRATTTILGVAIGVGAYPYSGTSASTTFIVASTTAAQDEAQARLFTPNQWLNIGLEPIGTVYKGGMSPDVDCRAIFQVTSTTG